MAGADEMLGFSFGRNHSKPLGHTDDTWIIAKLKPKLLLYLPSIYKGCVHNVFALFPTLNTVQKETKGPLWRHVSVSLRLLIMKAQG